MPIIPIDSWHDALLDPYRNMKDKELARDGGRFIAEGENVVLRMLASKCRAESVLIADRKQAAIVPQVPADIPVLVTSDDLIEQIIGFEFHSGVLACGIRPKSANLAEIIKTSPKNAVLTVCQQITNLENMGSLIRISAAFGVRAMILGERCCDPYFRMSVRVSMGNIFSMPIVRSENLLTDLDSLAQAGFDRVATVLDGDAVPLHAISHGPRVAVVFGNEAQGLDAGTIAHCNKRVTIPMKLGTDSLNVAVAAGIFLYELSKCNTENKSPLSRSSG